MADPGTMPPATAVPRRVVVDPVTRIEGHMRCEVDLDASNTIVNAVSSGTMWRGIEIILKDRDPRDAWAFAQRICGVCTGPHALASVRAVENALGIEIPENANTIRNIMQLTLQVHDHLVHFYHLHALDWVDVISGLSADPRATADLAVQVSDWPLASPHYFRNIQDRLKRFVASGQLGLFTNGYWGSPAYRLSPEANLMATTHYLEALDFQREIVKIHAVFGGKNPHPNWLVGGVPCAINMDTTGADGPINMERLALVSSIIDQSIAFVDQVYLPDVLAIASFYKDWLFGGGLAGKNILAYGDIPEYANDPAIKNLHIPSGAIINGNLNEIHEVNLTDPNEIKEYVPHSWYRYADETVGLHPFEGITEPNFALGPNTKGSRTNIAALDEAGKYSWIKAPRWKDHAMEMGPLSRLTIGYAQGNPEFKEPIDRALAILGLGTPALFSTLGRTLARALEASWAAHKMKYFFDKLMANIKLGDTATANTSSWHPSSWPDNVKGVGTTEAPRGALGHWLRIKDGKIDNYQCIVPTTWNGSPRDPMGQMGPLEMALLHIPMARPEEPLEILRTLHSFDPCLACATHVMAQDGREIVAVEVRT